MKLNLSILIPLVVVAVVCVGGYFLLPAMESEDYVVSPNLEPVRRDAARARECLQVVRATSSRTQS